MPSATTIYAAFDQLERTAEGAAQLAGRDPTTARAEAERARDAKRALAPLVGDQLVQEVGGPVTRRLRLPSGKTIEVKYE